MSETRIEPLSHKVPSPRRLGSTFRALTLAGATLTTGLAAGVFYAYAVSRRSPCTSQDPARAVSGWLLWPACSTLGADSC
jgi:hypothetical protein